MTGRILLELFDGNGKLKARRRVKNIVMAGTEIGLTKGRGSSPYPTTETPSVTFFATR
jgi:hypothetical protein